MGSLSQQPLHGTFSVPIWDAEPQSDPTTRPYLAPPKPKQVQHRKYKLVDFRNQVFPSASGAENNNNNGDGEGDDTRSRTFLSQHGFTAVKHPSPSLTTREEFESNDHVRETYYTEVRTLVKRITGCSDVIITISACRGGTPPQDLNESIPFKGVRHTREEGVSGGHRKVPLQPVRIPHCDDTVAGGRQFIRSGMMELRNAASRAGIVSREDEICAAVGVDAKRRESTSVLWSRYNDHAAERLGPRYAGFSIWRPWRTVTRNPLAMVSWSDVVRDERHVAWPYDNRIQGPDGDWTKELAMLKVRPEAAELGDVEDDLKFWYVSEQKPDEVLFVKMFDSAALGEGASEESGCLHGSPDLGDAAYGDERQSVEVRCYAIW